MKVARMPVIGRKVRVGGYMARRRSLRPDFLIAAKLGFMQSTVVTGL
jgi:hypothetical protein